MVVFDVTSKASFRDVEYWLTEIERYGIGYGFLGIAIMAIWLPFLSEISVISSASGKFVKRKPMPSPRKTTSSISKCPL